MKRLSLLTVLALVLSFSPQAVRAAVVDAGVSRVGVSKTALKADGIDNALVTVTVKDTNLIPLKDWKVALFSSRGSLDEIRVENDVTDILGKAYFRVFSLKDGMAAFTAWAGSVKIDMTVTVTYSGGLTFPLQAGDLIKIPDDGDVKTLNDTAVYYYATNGKRYVFPNEKTYYTWYPDFFKVKIIPLDQMSLIPIAGNVTHRPGTRMIKFQTDVKTYIVTRGGTLRWAKTEEVAKGWFGAPWNQFIDDVSESFYANYKFGEPVNHALDLALEIVRNATLSIDVDKGLAP